MAASAKQATEQNTPFPYGFKYSLKDWWNRSNLQQYEDDVLTMLPFYPNTDGTRVAETKNVDIGGDNYIHEFNICNTEAGKKQHIVMVHGYGAALGLFTGNFDDISKRPGVEIHALDLLGYGLSSRPKFPTRTRAYGLLKAKDVTLEDVTRAEDFFVDSMEAWRNARGIEKFTLIGHSMGGYLSSVYTTKYPQHVEDLVLISPVGVERSKYDLNPLEEAEILNPQLEISEVSLSSSLHKPNDQGYVTSYREYPKIIQYIWDNHHSPFDILRFAGPYGPMLASRWTFTRFSHLSSEQIKSFHNYTYAAFSAKASGEFALTRLLAPGALAYLPLLNRLPGKIRCRTLWLYGDHDWMSKEAGSVIVREINEKNPGSAELHVVSNAGHHVYLDNPQEFFTQLKSFLKW